jgi:predicted CXXCH cytochrome family protein
VPALTRAGKILPAMVNSLSKGQPGFRAIAAILLGIGLALHAPAPAVADAGPPPQFVGRATCTACHQPEVAAWTGSHHDEAMQEATEQTVLGDFNNATLTHFGVTSSFYRKDGKFLVRTDGPDGALHDYEIAYTFGVYPLQQYLVAFPGGRYQALPLAWDSRPLAAGGQHWFHLYPGEALPHGDALHWTGMNQTWNFMCADCHSTNLQRNFDLSTNAYHTTWSELDVSCEACHGPGSRHVAWAKAPASTAGDGTKGLVALLADTDGGRWVLDPAVGTATRTAPPSSSSEIETCALCHSRRHEIAGVFAYGHPLLDSAVPSLLAQGTYFPDGQVEDEDYEYGSFLQSLMHRRGVTCSNCHDPHSLKLRVPGNQLCAQCHLPARFDTATHTHHPVGSTGAQCANCHMPTRTYMVIDARRDHDIRIPRPDLSVSLNTPNACNNCHTDRSAQWAADQVAAWFGPNRRSEAHYGSIIDNGREGVSGADVALARLSMDATQPGIVRASALSLLPQFSADVGPDEIKAYLGGLQDADPLVRAAALEALAPFAPDQRLAVAAPLLSDNIKAVRIAAARALAPVPAASLTPEQQAALERASAELVAAEEATAERPESQLSIGAFLAERGKLDEAEAAYQAALRIDPSFAPVMVNLADLYRSTGRESEAEAMLHQAISRQADYAPAYYSLGLLYAREHRPADALPALQKALILAPDNPRYAYVYAIALNSAGQTRDALEILKRASHQHPADFDILTALATISRDAGDRQAAIGYAEELVRAAPNAPQARGLLESLRNASP